jgi:aldose 1-epimerase
MERSESAVTLGIDLVPTPGYPFPLRSEVTYRLTPDGLDVDLTTRNDGDRDAPYGVGFHTWLSPGPGPLDECLMSIDAQAWIRPDDRLLPVGVEAIPGPFDFRTARAVGSTELDDAFVDATFSDGRSWITLQGADGHTAATWMDESMPCWQVCTGDAVAAPGYRRAGLAAEPMTCIADAFRTGDDLIRLTPGQAHTVHWGLTLDPPRG